MTDNPAAVNHTTACAQVWRVLFTASLLIQVISIGVLITMCTGYAEGPLSSAAIASTAAIKAVALSRTMLSHSRSR
ncbi:hypothetical protein DFR70_12677 [Nocardia tenerifensis]|uniref:Uncharacterized protein n=1 Tax=Nocardia tenerifensis TaxID=228006 RepID=A0A318JRC1_9NOCA|nr:hypothetical protein [Nocardia tenerifensis]PXX53956.1 hypothetical protein DFR70_12677 [Nocardia tenerifensis]